MSDIKYRYKGSGHLYGIPARDMTADEFAALPLTSQRKARESGLYAEVADEEPPKQGGGSSADGKDKNKNKDGEK